MKALILAAAFIALAFPSFASVKYDANTRSLQISGVTTFGQASKVQSFVATKKIDTVFLSGPGGAYFWGIEIGRYIRKSGARVIVTADCASACAFAAIAAKNVYIDAGGRLLFHKPYIRSVPSLGYSIDDIAGKYMEIYLIGVKYLVKEMGFSFKFAQLVFSTKTTPCYLYVVKDTKTLNGLRGDVDRLPYMARENACAGRRG